jgi:mannose-6-phosphate isomerase-like protein (cupin superfamily)
MARVFSRGEGKKLGLPGRESLQIISGEVGARSVTLRLATIPVSRPGDNLRRPHQHCDFEECIYVLGGTGVTLAESGDFNLRPGDTILIPPGEKHMTQNTGNLPLQLLCFFPVANIAPGTEEPGVPAGKKP